ncbi:hypothetical protein B0T16DRAFT_135241 [Cercophora newfieldiana]|uniref:Hemerythrin-like domain-containing protein n=1 Tax=Cercophora newfieldiana TaxID=92897 RepID=A0AA39YC87_9PEZI|nr:hypothetical protein B0T16DRAFT_135241 [Cercophora newfieldiana]
MAIYADHPFALIPTPSSNKHKDPTLGKPDLFDSLASDMALAHNMLIRALNSIYLQAPHITTPSDEKAFCRYILTFHRFLHIHHTNEESDFFPSLETMAGEKGVMDVNVQQHQAFEKGVKEFREYVEGVSSGKERYDGERVVSMIDVFGGLLVKHLTEEIGTLEALRRFGEERMGQVMRKADQEAERSMREMGLSGIAWAWSHIDTQFEDGLWASWPPAPAPVKFLTSTMLWRVYGSMVKFGACDKHGNMKPLFAVPKDGS